KVGIARYVLRNREHIGVIKTSGNVILLDQMRYHADIRDANELNLPDKKMAEKKEIDMAMKLIDQLTGPFTPENFKDEYIEELRQIIEAKAEGKLIVSKEEAPEPTHVKDLMETLKASLNAVKDKPVAKNRTPVSGAAKGRKKPAGKKKKKEA
ncbi:MAG TPA: Ku protein, partial [Cytophagaceae bacterium]